MSVYALCLKSDFSSYGCLELAIPASSMIRYPLVSFLLLFVIFRLGFLIDFLSHAAIVGFMAGAAITIALQQLKGFLGIKKFTKKTDIISVMHSVFESAQHGVNCLPLASPTKIHISSLIVVRWSILYAASRTQLILKSF